MLAILQARGPVVQVRRDAGACKRDGTAGLVGWMNQFAAEGAPYRDRARPSPATHSSHPNQGGRYRRRCLTITPDRRYETERKGYGKGHHDELGDA
jgi:hypothetical protein